MNKKNILIVSHGAALGGSPISAINIGRFIDRAKFNPIFVFGEKGPIANMAKKEGFKVFIIKKHGFMSLATIIDFLKVLKKEKVDLVHLNTLTSYYKYPAIASKILNKKVVWFVRENPEEKRCLKLSKYINRFSDKAVTVSYDTAEHIDYIDNEKLITIHNGIDLNYYDINNLTINNCCKLLKLDSNCKYITTIASIEKRKGIIDLIEAYNNVYKKLDNVKLLIVGKDRTREQKYLKEVIELIKLYKLENNVILYGESKNIKEILKISKIFVLCAYWEGLSRVLLEAMACRKLIVASSNGGNKEQVIDDFNGFTYNAGDIEKLSKNILKSFKLKDFNKYELNSRIYVEKNFDIKITTKKIEELYLLLLNK